MKRRLLVSTTAYPGWLRRVAFSAVEVALLLAYQSGALVAWKRSLHGAGRHRIQPAMPRRHPHAPAA
jgi:hypothetical protein